MITSYRPIGPTGQATCRIVDANGVTREGACTVPPVTVTVQPQAQVTASAQPGQVNWLLLGAIALGIYLITKG